MLNTGSTEAAAAIRRPVSRLVLNANDQRVKIDLKLRNRLSVSNTINHYVPVIIGERSEKENSHFHELNYLKHLKSYDPVPMDFKKTKFLFNPFATERFRIKAIILWETRQTIPVVLPDYLASSLVFTILVFNGTADVFNYW